MSPRDLFDVAVRVLGAVVIVWGLWDLINSALFYTEYFTHPDTTFRYYLISGWASIFIGLMFVRFAEVLVNFAYPDNTIDQLVADDQTESSETGE